MKGDATSDEETRQDREIQRALIKHKGPLTRAGITWKVKEPETA